MPKFRFAGVLLAAGCVVFIVGVAFYAFLPRELGAPAFDSTYPGVQTAAAGLKNEMERAGRVIFLGDLLIAASALALLPRTRHSDSDIERVGWALICLSFVPAFVFDSLFGSALPRLALGAPEASAAFKSWFDLQFAMGNIPFGVGASAVFLADVRAKEPTLPAPIDYLGALCAVMALVGGLGYVLGLVRQRHADWRHPGPRRAADGHPRRPDRSQRLTSRTRPRCRMKVDLSGLEPLTADGRAARNFADTASACISSVRISLSRRSCVL